jgi:protocatechuate 3,4-dioxygenase beta subunit
MRRAFAFALALLCPGPHALAQTPGAPTVTGRVISASNNLPLRRTRIEVSSGSWRAAPALTDDTGRFVVEVGGIAAVTLTATKGGYTVATTTIPRNSLATSLELILPRAAAISGVVVDPKGAPVPGYTVTVRRLNANPAQDASPPQFTGVTDDLGEYRVGGLPRGTYDVAAGSLMPVLPNTPGFTPEHGLGANVRVMVDTGDELGGVQLVAPAVTGADAVLQGLLREKAGLPPIEPRNIVLPRGLAASVSGRVLTAARMPIAGATVRVLGPGANVTVRTDENGAYLLRGLRPGRYTVEAAVRDQMVWRHGQDRVGQAGRPVVVATDQAVDGIDVVLPRGRVVRGAVFDEHGEPVQGASIDALQVEFVGDRLVAREVAVQRRTDDRGSYRLWGLYEGTYLIRASWNGVVSGGGTQATYATLYYPGSPTVAEAQRIDLREDATANIVFAPVTLTDVSGIALDGDAQLVAGTARLIEVRQQGLVSSPRTSTIQPDGTFTIRHVPPGSYVLQVLGDGPGRTGLFSAQEVSVGRTPVRVVMKTSHGTSVEGRLIIEGDPEQVRCNSITVINSTGVAVQNSCGPSFQIVPTALDDRARVEPTMAVIGSTEFFLTGLFGPTAFNLRRATGDDWYLKSFTINGIDISDTGFDFGAQPAAITDAQLVLSRNGAEITGRLRDPGATSYFVVAFSTSRQARFAYSRRVKFARAGADGSFRIAGLPPGDYFVAAVDSLDGTAEGGEWQNPELLARLEAGAERITVLEGQTQTVSPRLITR